MALFSLIFGGPERAEIGGRSSGGELVGGMILDASISEDHQRNAQITDSEIEDGALVSDHIILEPVRLELEALVSDVPVQAISPVFGTAIGAIQQSAAQAAGGGLLGQAASAVTGETVGSLLGLVTGTPRDPRDAWKVLEALWKAREPFNMITALTRYENMVIETLSAPRSADVGKALRFNVSMRQVTIVTSELVPIPAFKVAATAEGGTSSADLGRQSTQETSEATADRGTALSNLVDGGPDDLANYIGGRIGDVLASIGL